MATLVEPSWIETSLTLLRLVGVKGLRGSPEAKLQRGLVEMFERNGLTLPREMANSLVHRWGKREHLTLRALDDEVDWNFLRLIPRADVDPNMSKELLGVVQACHAEREMTAAETKARVASLKTKRELSILAEEEIALEFDREEPGPMAAPAERVSAPDSCSLEDVLHSEFEDPGRKSSW